MKVRSNSDIPYYLKKRVSNIDLVTEMFDFMTNML